MAGKIFDGRRLTLSRWAAGLTKRELAQQIGVSPSSVTQYEAGNTEPSLQTIRRAALGLGVPVEYFYSDQDRRTPRLETRSFFRSLRATRQWQRDRADAAAEHLYDLVEFLDQRLRLPAVAIPSHSISNAPVALSGIEEIAGLVRAEWDLPPGPISNVVRILETQGAVVARIPEVPHEVDAFSRWFELRPIVLLSSIKEDKGRSRFDAAHELGHLVLHPEPEPGDRAQERQAHAFAAGFLMPLNDVEQDLPRRLTRPEHWEELFTTRQRWGVSAAALLYRSRELEVISDSSFRRAMTRLSELGLRRDDGKVLGEPEQPILISEALRSLQNAFGLDMANVAAALQFSEKQLKNLIGDWPDERSTEPKRHLRSVVWITEPLSDRQ